MKHLLYSIQKQAYRWMVAALCIAAGTACNPIYDDDDDCPTKYRVRFIYDWNMLFTDAFPKQAKEVTLYVFGEDGKLVAQQTEQGNILETPGFSMPLDVPAGKYTLMAYASGTKEHGGEPFTIPAMAVGTSQQADFTMTVPRTRQEHLGEEAMVTRQLIGQWHGRTEVTLAKRAPKRVEYVTVPLIKDTNTIRIILQQLADEPMEDDRFDVQITDENGLMDYQNNLIAGNGVLTYLPYYHKVGQAVTGNEPGAGMNMLVSELSTARLMADHHAKGTITTRLRITDKKTNETILSIPLIDYLEVCRTVANYSMPLQEYLDREDTYVMTFFLDKEHHWIKAQIIINDWIVRFNDITAEI